MKREELLKVAKPMAVNLEVAKTIPNKTQTRRVATELLIPNTYGFKTVEMVYLNHNTNGFELYRTPTTEKGKDGLFGGYISAWNSKKGISERTEQYIKPKWKVGDILWVREPAEIICFLKTGSSSEGDYQEKIWFKYVSDGKEDYINMPERFERTPNWTEVGKRVPNGCLKEMARTFLRVTNVRVDNLQDISILDIYKEGMDILVADYRDFEGNEYPDSKKIASKKHFIPTWNKTAPKGYKWEDNPYVFVYKFEKV